MSNFQNRKEHKAASSSSNDSHCHDASSSPFPPLGGVSSALVTSQYNNAIAASNDRTRIREALNNALGCHHPEEVSNVNWTTVHGLLLQFCVSSLAVNQQEISNSLYESLEEDPLGRIFLTRLLARDPPMQCLDAALRAFPLAVTPSNPVAFFTACSDASPETITLMMQHVISISKETMECPYPWILSPYISIEAAHAMLQGYPQGVWQTSNSCFLSCESRSYTLLDYILFSPAMTAQRDFDEALWQKFKLILVTADSAVGCEISPVHTVLDRILACPGKTGCKYCVLQMLFVCVFQTERERN
jgi:hypothetical protein